jgi:uncharacterized protein YuzE
MKFSYDDDADVLYVTFGEYDGKAVYVENANGDILRVKPETDEILGVTIPFFLRRSSETEIVIPEVGLAPFTTIMAKLLEERRTHGKH